MRRMFGRPVRRLTVGLACGMLGLLLGAGPAAAQLAGVSIQITSIDPPGVECFAPYPSSINVDVVATIFYGGGYAFSTAWLGESSGFGTIAPAIDWGDGSIVPPLYPTGMPFDTTSTPPGAPGPLRAYRAAFSHTYAFTLQLPPIQVASANLLFSPGYAFTGNTATFQTPSYSIFGGIVTVLTNTAQISISIPACEEIDTVSDVGLVVLALILAAAGMFLLRR